MPRPFTYFLAVCAALCAAAPPATTANAQSPTKNRWAATGTLFEACTCAVPCTCNFGEGPSPHSYCHAVFAYKLDKASWDGVDLSGLLVAAADGPSGESAFSDDRATPAQKAALEKLGFALLAQGGATNTATRFAPAALTADAKGNTLRVAVGTFGGFAARVIVGRDGKTPVVVENNTVWPIRRAIKGKTSSLTFSDTPAGTIRTENSNANYGAFTFGGTIDANAAKSGLAKSAKKACCQ